MTLRMLIGKLDLKNADEVFAIVKGYYPHKAIKPETRILIEELVSKRDLNRCAMSWVSSRRNGWTKFRSVRNRGL